MKAYVAIRITNASLKPIYAPKRPPNATQIELIQKPRSNAVTKFIVISTKGSVINTRKTPRPIPTMIGPSLSVLLKIFPITNAVEILKINANRQATLF